MDKRHKMRSQAMNRWAAKRQVKIAFVQSRKPSQSWFVKSFIGRFRDECLNEYIFRILHDVKDTIAAWQEHYNTNRPHSSLDGNTPVELAQTLLETVHAELGMLAG